MGPLWNFAGLICASFHFGELIGDPAQGLSSYFYRSSVKLLATRIPLTKFQMKREMYVVINLWSSETSALLLTELRI